MTRAMLEIREGPTVRGRIGGQDKEAGGQSGMGAEVAGGRVYVLAAPVAPGKEETWRRFLQEVAESPAEYERLRLDLGIRRELVWLVPRAHGYVTVAHLEISKAFEEFVRRLTDAEDNFALWFKEGISECHGVAGPAWLSPVPILEPIFSWGKGPGRS